MGGWRGEQLLRGPSRHLSVDEFLVKLHRRDLPVGAASARGAAEAYGFRTQAHLTDESRKTVNSIIKNALNARGMCLP